MTRRSAAIRLSLFYGAFFLLAGIQLPFWPIWLASRGLGPAEIGLVVGLPLWVRVAANLVSGAVADATQQRRLQMVCLASVTFLCYLAFRWVDGFWPILLLTLVAAAVSSVMPLGETIALATSERLRLDYGRLRLWGSLTFILAAVAAGQILADAAPEILLTLLAGGAGLVVAACLVLPDSGETPPAGPRLAGWRGLLAAPGQLAFLAAATLVQASHSVYYAFGSLHWRAIGFSDATIGWLWAEGVVAEIVLFWAGAALVGRLGPAGLLLVAGAAGVLRWTVTAWATSLPLLFLIQTLHAFTFGAAHLGAMHHIRRAVPPGLASSAQALYAAISSGIGFGLAMWLSGSLFARWGALAYLAMAAMCAAGMLAALRLRKVREN